MQCHIYYATDEINVFLILPHKIESHGLPQSLRDKFKNLGYLGEQEIVSGKHILGIEGEEVKESIEKKGYYIKGLNKEETHSYNSDISSLVGGALLLGGLLGPIGWVTGPLLGLWAASKAKGNKNDPKL